ncbi:unnamed protein product, partial [Allacma fusca]
LVREGETSCLHGAPVYAHSISGFSFHHAGKRQELGVGVKYTRPKSEGASYNVGLMVETLNSSFGRTIQRRYSRSIEFEVSPPSLSSLVEQNGIPRK